MMSLLPKTKGTSSSLSTMLVPLPLEGKDLQYMLITDGPTIERLLLRQNINHFAQAKVTPLAPSQIMEKLGCGAQSRLSDSILDSTADIPSITPDHWAQAFLKKCYRRQPEINVDFTIHSVISKLQKWRETTSTSPSGRHLGHYHALFRPYLLSGSANDDDRADFEDMRDKILDTHF